MTKPVRAKFPTSFGVFSPTGHIVMAFPDDARAGRARAALLAGGFSEGEVTQYDKNDVIAESEKSLKQEANPVQIGQDVAKARSIWPSQRKAADSLWFMRRRKIARNRRLPSHIPSG